jgi:hypothetical protein
MYNKLKISIVWIMMLVSAFFFSCSKKSDVGKIIIPSDYLLKPDAQDTFRVVARTYSVDSLSTSSITYGLLGSYIDPVFGEFKASFITEIMRTSTPNFTSSYTFDSVKLVLRYDTVYLNSSEQEINIAELKESLIFDSTYYHNFDPTKVRQELIYKTKFTPNSDTVLAVKLPYSFGLNIFNNANDGYKWADTTFATFFHGFYIYSNPVVKDACIAAFNLFHTDTRLTLFYHNNSDTISDTLRYSFPVGTYSTRFNMFQHKYSPDIIANLNDPNAQVVYLQGGGGLNVNIELPDLDILKKQGLYAVNRAELVINADPYSLGDHNYYPTPKAAELYYRNDNGAMEFLSEYYTSDGNYLYANYLDDQFVFDITYMVQKIIAGKKKNNGFVLTVKDSKTSPARIVLTSGKNSKPMKLKLTLTKLPIE